MNDVNTQHSFPYARTILMSKSCDRKFFFEIKFFLSDKKITFKAHELNPTTLYIKYILLYLVIRLSD